MVADDGKTDLETLRRRAHRPKITDPGTDIFRRADGGNLSNEKSN